MTRNQSLYLALSLRGDGRMIRDMCVVRVEKPG